MGFWARLLGNEGVVRYEGTTLDGREFTGKVSIETIGYSKEEIEEYLKNAFYVEKGIKVKTFKITGFYET